MSDTASPSADATKIVPPRPTLPAAVAAQNPVARHAAVVADDDHRERVAAPPRSRRRPGVLIALVGGAALLLALVFGGGMAAGWALSQAQGPASFAPGEFPGGSDGPGFGPGAGSGEQGTVPTRPDDSSGDADSSDDANS